MNDGDLHMRVMRHLPFAGRDGAYAAGSSIVGGDLSLEFSRRLGAPPRSAYHAANREANRSEAALRNDQQAIAPSVVACDEGVGPRFDPTGHVREHAEWSDGLRVSVPNFE